MTDLALPTLAGFRVLVVEDMMLVALEIEAMLAQLGCLVIGPVSTVSAALPLARDAPLDAAILDVNLNGANVFPVAEQLQMRGIPFVLATGYSPASIPEAWRHANRLDKPFTGEQLQKVLTTLARA